MRKLLLDTHTVIWLASGVNVGPRTRALVKQVDVVYVSAISILEIRLKQSAGKLSNANAIINAVSDMDFTVLELTQAHTEPYRVFAKNNKDPFDNTLVSIAIQESIPFITADKKILAIDNPKLKTIDART